MSVPGINPGLIAVAISMEASKQRSNGGPGKEPDDEDEKLTKFSDKLAKWFFIGAVIIFVIVALIKAFS